MGVVLLLLGMSACSLLVDTSGLSSGSDPRDDGGSPSDGSAVQDGPGVTDGPAGDGSTSDGATIDGGGGDGGDPCSGKTVCEDFEGTAPNAAWDLNVENGTLLRLDGVRPRNGKQSLHATRKANNPSKGAFMSLALGAKLDVACEMDAWVENLGSTDTAEIATITHRATTMPRYESAYLFVNPTVIGIGEFEIYSDGGTALKQQISIGAGSTNARWFHIALHVHDSVVDFSVVDDNGNKQSKTMTITKPTLLDTTLFLGTPYGEGNREVDVFIDDYRCVAK